MKVSFRSLVRTALALGLCAGMGSLAQALIFYSDAETIFVGKGDYQLACGLNNAQAQTRLSAATSADFAVRSSSTVTADVTCEWETVTGGKNSKTITHSVTNSKTASIDTTKLATYQERKQQQITGIFLHIAGEVTTSSGSLPAVGQACPPGSDNAGKDGVITAVIVTAESSTPESVYTDCSNGDNPTTLVGAVQ